MLLEKNSFFIKEHVDVLKLAGTYDILDPETSAPIGVAKEEISTLVKILKFMVNKQMLPTKVTVYEQDGQPVFTIQRPFSLFRKKVTIQKSTGEYLGYFKSKILTIGGGFFVFDAAEQQVAEIKGNWKGWDFKFLTKDGREIGAVNKKWAGLAKEIFTTADNYLISLNPVEEVNPDAKILLLAAGLAVDLIYKEEK